MKKYSLYIMAVLYIITGTIHFIKPAFYNGIMPAWLPAHFVLIYTSGAAEFLLGIFLLVPATRKISAWTIIAMLWVFLFLIHIPLMMEYWKSNNAMLWLALVRLPLQFYLIWWAKKYTRSRVPRRRTI